MKIIVPWPSKDLSPNARVHHFAKARAVKAYRVGCAWEAKTQGLPRVEASRIDVTITFHPPDMRRRDRDNMIGSIKSGADGIADAIGVDDARWIPTYQVGEPVNGGRVVFDFPSIVGKQTDRQIDAVILENRGTIS